MRKQITAALVILGMLLPNFVFAQATTVQGGTGTSSPSGILYGDGTLHMKTVVIGSNMTFSGGTLSSTGGAAAAWPFTPSTYNGVSNQSTTTPFWLKNTQIIASTTLFTMASTSGFTNNGSTWLTNLTNGQLLSLGANGLVQSTTTIGNNQLANSSITVNGTAISLGSSGTITAATSSLLTDSNTFSGNNLFSASTTFSTQINLRNASTSQETIGTAWFPNLAAYNLIATDANSKVVATSSIGNSLLANSTISGISLGGTLGALSATDATLTFSGSYTGATARTVGVNLGNANIWTALQLFTNNASSTQFSANTAYFGGSATTTIDTAGNVTLPSSATLTATKAALTNATTTTLNIQGAENALISTDQNGNVIATSTPTAARFISTSTAATNIFPNATTTNLTTGTANYAVNGLTELPLSVASSTWGTGTTTVTLLGTTRALTVVDASCPNDTGLFLGVDLYYGSTHLNFLISSSTQNTFLFSTNNVVPAGSKLLADIGTSTAPAAGYKKFNCTLEYAYNGSS